MASKRGLTDTDRIDALAKIIEYYSDTRGFPVIVKEKSTGIFWFEEVRDVNFRMALDRVIVRLQNKGKL